MGDKKDVKKKTSIFDDEEIEELLEVEPKRKEDKEDKKSKSDDKEEKTPKKEEKTSKKDDDNDSKKENKEEKESSKKDEKKDLDKKKAVVAPKTSTKTKKDDEDELLEEEESESIGIKIVIGIVVIAIIVILLLKSCGSETAKYSIKFDTNGGTAVSTLEIEENALITKPADPTKEGYVFVGWYYNDELYDFSKPVTGDITLEARWAEEEIIPVSGVTLDQTTLKLSIGGRVALIATVAPENAKDKSLTWTSSDETIVTVDANGNVTGVKEGTATVTVTTNDGGFTASAKVTVSADVVAVTGVTLDKTTLELVGNQSATLKATVAPTNASNKGVTWASSNPKAATVDATGKVTAKGEGTTTITVTTKDGGFTATCTVTVTNVKVTGVTVAPTTKTMNVGETTTVKATVAPANATNKTLTWTTSNNKVATVDANGKITAVSAGEATITVTTKDGNHKATVIVTVNNIKVTGVTVTPTSKALYVGETTTAKATVAPTNATIKDVTWTSSKPAVATVDANGKITAVSVGAATITVTTKDGSFSQDVVITVKEKVAATGVTISGSTSGTEGGTIQLTAEVTPDDTYDKSVTWASDNQEVATVSSTGKVSLKKPGTVKITATTKNGVSATHTITVKEKPQTYSYTVKEHQEDPNSPVYIRFKVYDSKGTDVTLKVTKFGDLTRITFADGYIHTTRDAGRAYAEANEVSVVVNGNSATAKRQK